MDSTQEAVLLRTIAIILIAMFAADRLGRSVVQPVTELSDAAHRWGEPEERLNEEISTNVGDDDGRERHVSPDGNIHIGLHHQHRVG